MFNITLKKLREEANLSQYALAPLLKVSQSTIGNWESGIRVPDATMLCTIANFFNVSVDYLLGREKQQDEFIGQSFEVSEKKELSIRLKELRKQQNITQKDISDYLQTSQQTYSRYEKGQREPDIATIIKLADFFNVSVDYLLGRENNTALLSLSEPSLNVKPEYQRIFERLSSEAKENMLELMAVFSKASIKTQLKILGRVEGWILEEESKKIDASNASKK